MSGLDRLGRQLAREQDALRADGARRAQVRVRIAATGATPVRAPRPRMQRAAAGAAAALIAAAAAYVLFLRAPQAEPLRLHAGASGARVLPGEWLEAPQGKPLGLHFSDGTRIELAARTRARVESIGVHGARLLIESGRARAAVVHKPGATWQLDLGPFAVHVIGTRFEVGWDPEHDAFQLALEQGRVELSGCVFGRGYAMRAGQLVDASCRSGSFHVGDRVASVPAAATPQPAADTADAAASPSAVQHAQAPGRRAAPRSPALHPSAAWRELAQQGRYAEAFSAAQALGFEAECGQAGAGDLALLAESARYAGQGTEEALALRAMRHRFAGTSRAAVAAFALGRLEFDEHQSYAKAARWFGTYLKEQPRGALSREARGRLIEATLAAGERDRARALASSYLRDHPEGPHAELARSLLDGSADAPAPRSR